MTYHFKSWHAQPVGEKKRVTSYKKKIIILIKCLENYITTARHAQQLRFQAT